MIGLHAEKLFDDEIILPDRVVLIEGPRIAAIVTQDAVPPGTRVESLGDTLLAPGFVDVQVNGGGGRMLNDAITVNALRSIAAAHARHGTTTILPTLISGTRTQLHQALAAAAAALAQGVPGLAGLHLEGPFIAPSRRGIHPAAAMTTPDAADLSLLCTPFPGRLLVTLAPEIVAAADIARLAAIGVVVFAGHTDATLEQARAGLAAGITGFTHLFNAMSQLGARAPGAVGAALSSDAYAGIIVDLHHVHPAAVRIAHAAKTASRLFLVSDAMATAASELHDFVLNGETIRLENGRLTNADGTLAGAHLTMAEAVRNAAGIVGLPDALRMATATPCDAIGLHDRGRIAPGLRADLVALTPDLHVQTIWQNGVRL